jgi:hypothetical protein
MVTGENWHTVAFWASLTVLAAFLYWRLFAMFAQLPATKKEGIRRPHNLPPRRGSHTAR